MKRLSMAFIICLLLAGCWDRDQLKKLLFVDIIGIDYKNDSKQLKVSYVISSLRDANQGGGSPSNLYLESTGDSLYDSVATINKEMAGILSVLETRLFLISSKFAKDQPLNYLNITAQFIANPLTGYLAVYDGDLSKLLNKKKIKDKTVSEFLVGLLEDEKKRGKIPSNVLFQYILGGTGFINDFTLNRFEPFGDEVRLAGSSLFRDGKYTGINLNNEDTQLAYLMAGAAGKNQPLFGKIDEKNYSVLLQKAKRNFRISSNHDGLREIDILLKLDLKLVEAGLGVQKYSKKMLTVLEKKIADDLREKASSVITTLQKANCDYLQLGQELAVYHPKLYSGMNWREQYPKISIKPQVKVRILNSGVVE